VDFGEFPEKEPVVGHRVKDTRGGEYHAIGGAESRNQNGKGDDFAGPWAEDGADSGGGDGVSQSHIMGAEGEEVSEDSEQIECDKNQRAH